MRRANDLIELLRNLHEAHEWEAMEEYFAAAEILLLFHGARFRPIEDVRDYIKREVFNGVVEDKSSRFYGFACDCCLLSFTDYMEYKLEQCGEYQAAIKYSDSEEGWREEASAGGYKKQSFMLTCYKFIDFKYNL